MKRGKKPHSEVKKWRVRSRMRSPRTKKPTQLEVHISFFCSWACWRKSKLHSTELPHLVATAGCIAQCVALAQLPELPAQHSCSASMCQYGKKSLGHNAANVTFIWPNRMHTCILIWIVCTRCSKAKWDSSCYLHAEERAIHCIMPANRFQKVSDPHTHKTCIVL